MVALAARVLAEESLDDLRPKLPAGSGSPAEQHVARELTQRPAEPGAERDPEAGLASGGELGRQQVRERTAERHLPPAAAEAQRVGERDAELEDAVVEKRRAELEGSRHRRSIGLHEQVVGEVGAGVEQLQAGDPGRRGSAEEGRGRARRAAAQPAKAGV